MKQTMKNNGRKKIRINNDSNIACVKFKIIFIYLRIIINLVNFCFM